MAFALDSNNEDDQQAASQVDVNNPQGGTGVGVASPGSLNQQNPGGGVSLGGTGSAVSGSQSAAGGQPGGGNVGGSLSYSAAPPQTKNQQNNGWTNVQDYLTANADQSEQLGNQISSNVSNQAQAAENDVNNASTDFTNQVNAGIVQANPTSINQDLTDAQNLKAGQTYSNSDLNDYQTQANANYKGPTDFTTDSQYGQAKNALTNASQSLSQLGSEAGRDVLLQNQYGNASPTGYNQGESNLDQLLLEGNPVNQTAMQNVRNQYAGINSILENATNQQNAAAQAAVVTDQATAAAAHAALANANTTFQGNVNTGFTQAQQNSTAAYNQAVADLASGNLTAADISTMGLGGVTNLYNANPSQYLTQGEAPTLFESATPDQYAQAGALAQLAGQSDSSFLPSAYASQSGNIPNPYAYNTAALNAAIGNDQASYTQLYQTTPVTMTTPSGQQFTNTMAGIRKQIAETQQDLAVGGSPNADRAYLNEAIPALANAEATLANKFQTGRNIQNYGTYGNRFNKVNV